MMKRLEDVFQFAMRTSNSTLRKSGSEEECVRLVEVSISTDSNRAIRYLLHLIAPLGVFRPVHDAHLRSPFSTTTSSPRPAPHPHPTPVSSSPPHAPVSSRERPWSCRAWLAFPLSRLAHGAFRLWLCGSRGYESVSSYGEKGKP